MSEGLLILVSAPSGAGKTSLVNAAIAADSRLVSSISYTTRAQRAQEQDGVNYHFTDAQHFAAMVERGEFLEHAEVFGNRYGTAKSSVEKLQAAQKDVVLEIDWQGADQVRKVLPNALSIFILPPSVATLSERLKHRGQDSEASMQRRLADARLEMAQAPRYEYIIVNENFEQALTDLQAILQSARLRSSVQMTQNTLVQSVLSEG